MGSSYVVASVVDARLQYKKRERLELLREATKNSWPQLLIMPRRQRATDRKPPVCPPRALGLGGAARRVRRGGVWLGSPLGRLCPSHVDLG